MAFQLDESSRAERRLCGEFLGNEPQRKAIDYSIWSWGQNRAFLVPYAETKSTGLTSL